jgi:Zn-dependent protease with chaperone function
MVRIKTAAALIILLIPLISFSAESPKNLRQYWVDMYGEVQRNESDVSMKTFSIFDRMVAAADKRANRLPQLLILKNYRKLLARSLPDGTVVISKEIPELLSRYEYGDQVIALVIGHELAHLANDDFWELYAFNDTGDGFLKVDKERQLWAFIHDSRRL